MNKILNTLFGLNLVLGIAFYVSDDYGRANFHMINAVMFLYIKKDR